MQSLQNSLETELSRILSSNTSVQLTKQLKSFNTYEKKIEEEIMTKSAQIMQLQNFLKNEIENIQNIVEENNGLKKDLQIRNKELSVKNVVQLELQKEVQALTEMNRASSFIIKSLEERNQQLQTQIKVINQSNKTIQNHFTRREIFNLKVYFKKEKYSDLAVNTDMSLLAEPTPSPKQSQKISNLQAKIKQLEATIISLNIYNSELCLKLQCYQSTSNQSVSQSWPEQSIVQQRKSTSQILQMICDQSLVQLRFKGQLVNGSKEGKGVCEYEGNINYEGYFKNNKRHGLGSFYYHDQLIYRGYWAEGLMEGKGLLKMLEGQIQSYEGQFIEGKLEGYGLMKLKSGKNILGFWKDGRIEGNCLEQNQKIKRLSKPEMIQCY